MASFDERPIDRRVVRQRAILEDIAEGKQWDSLRCGANVFKAPLAASGAARSSRRPRFGQRAWLHSDIAGTIQESRGPGATYPDNAVVVGVVDVARGRPECRGDVVESAAPEIPEGGSSYDGTVMTWHGERFWIPVETHSHAFPPRSDCPHFPSPLGDFDPTVCRLVHVPPQ